MEKHEKRKIKIKNIENFDGQSFSAGRSPGETYKKYFFIGLLATLVLVILVACFVFWVGNKNRDSAGNSIDFYFGDLNESGQFIGSVYINYNNDKILNKQYGEENLRQRKKLSKKSRYFIGPSTEQFTAFIVLLLEDKGFLSRSDPLEKYFPGFPMGDSILLHDLLTHSSGIRDYLSDEKIFRMIVDSRFYRPISDQEILFYLKKQGLLFYPGTRYSFSNSDYFLLGMIIEQITGKHFESVSREYIFKPFRLKSAGIIKNGRYPRNLVSEFSLVSGTSSSFPYEFFNADSGLYLALSDAVKWLDFLADPGNYGSTYRAIVDKMMTPYIDHHGYGYFIKKDLNTKSVYFIGRFNLYSNIWYIDYSNRVSFVILSNAPADFKQHIKKIYISLGLVSPF